MRLNQTSAFSPLKLGEGNKVPNEVQVLRVGKFKHPSYGDFEITTQVLSEMKTNFDKKIRGIDMAFDYYHASDKDASAWVQALELRENGTELWAVQVDWTPKASQKLSERELRYFSPDFAFKWQDPESGTIYKNVLFGGGLTNRPFVKEMQAIVADETKTGENDMTELEKSQARVKELETQAVKLSEEKSAMEKQMADMPKPDKVAQLEQQIAALQAELAKAKGEGEAALAEKKKLEEQAKLAEKEKEFNILLSEGKACAAQKDAFVKGNMQEFIKLAQPVNMNGSGGAGGGNDTTDKNEKVLKLAEEKMKADSKLSKGDAISLALAEVK